jgi:hypothetical protein
MATLVITPLISAETWLGAAGCASGSQTCSGTTPAFDPAPRRARPSTSAPIVADGPEARISANEYPPSGPASRPKHSSSASAPKPAITR